MKQTELEALLGRPLTPTEASNRKLYLEIAKESLEQLLCISLCDDEDETRTFDIREGYSTVFTDIFTELTAVQFDGVATTDYYPAFWDKRNNPYYNSIVLDDCGGSTISITGAWGFSEIPSDLKLLWAQLFANVSKKYTAGGGNIKSKRVEDFSITYGDLTDDEVFLSANARTIQKYSMCNTGYIRHGKTCKAHRKLNCGYCI
jgi:hypothetical protein